jgi:hypothetical protein
MTVSKELPIYTARELHPCNGEAIEFDTNTPDCDDSSIYTHT